MLGILAGCLGAFYRAERGAWVAGNEAGEVGAIDGRPFEP
jgi:hypothetical protein